MTNTVPDPQAVLEQLEEIKRKYLEAQSDVASVRATGFDSDHQVSVTVLGLGEVAGITIDPAVANPSDVEGLQKRILQAFRSANNQARDLAAQILAPLNISLPQPSPEPQPEPAPTVSALSLSESAVSPSLSPGISLSPDIALSAPPESAPPEPSASAPTAPTLDLTLDDAPAPQSPAPALDLTLDEPPTQEPASPSPVVAEPASAEPEPASAEPELALAAPAKPSLANYQHYRPRW